MTTWHRDIKEDTGAIVHSLTEVGEGCSVSMWVSCSGKKKKSNKLPHIPVHRHTCLKSETPTTATEVSGYFTILICFINTHGPKRKTHTKPGQHVQATKAFPPWGGGSHWCLCVFNGPQLDQGLCKCQSTQNL